MYNGVLHLHNLLRWVILLLLLIVIFQSFTKSRGLLKTSLFLLIATHIQFLIGVYQWLAGNFGYKLIKGNGFGEVMKNSVQRFWAVEHITGMLIATILITAARGKIKRGAYNSVSWMYLVALIVILLVVPWPFREGVGRPWFPGMK